MLTLNQIKQVVQAESDYIIKELKASSSSVASKLYAKATCFFITITPVLKTCVSVSVSHELTIKSGSETSEQHLQTKQDIIQNVSKVIDLLNVILAACCLSSEDVTFFFNLELSYSI